MANETISRVVDFLDKNTGAVLAGAGGILAGTAIGVGVAKATSSKKNVYGTATKRKRRKTQSSKKKRTSKRKSKKRKTKYARTAGKRKDRSSRRIRQTKTGQPYIILANGKARFIKKSSARTSRKRRGGRY